MRGNRRSNERRPKEEQKSCRLVPISNPGPLTPTTGPVDASHCNILCGFIDIIKSCLQWRCQGWAKGGAFSKKNVLSLPQFSPQFWVKSRKMGIFLYKVVQDLLRVLPPLKNFLSLPPPKKKKKMMLVPPLLVLIAVVFFSSDSASIIFWGGGQKGGKKFSGR